MKDNGPPPIPTCQSSRLSGPVKRWLLETNGDTRALGSLFSVSTCSRPSTAFYDRAVFPLTTVPLRNGLGWIERGSERIPRYQSPVGAPDRRNSKVEILGMTETS
ncbi:hypothetical protein ElyMa_005467200 [Elysia marginata]|uniref:Uncharacterized protein n=1 Tax=Elysia marginata TaxID=1093978 RepID=A0AAV4EQX7_9GAST|nr:hypothetical protein ElyMa_005467200 [Elysia marginata]